MYNDFFGFRERPFSVTPDPRIFYETPSYQRIYNNLVHSILEGKSLAVLTGEVGTGKTTVLRRIMRELERFVRFAYFTYTTLPFDDLLDFICEDLEIPHQHGGQLQKLKALQEFLAARQNQGQSAVLLIDEAQNLQEAVLEEIRHLLNLTTESKALLPVILVGQPELEKKLASPTLYQLKQRVTIHCQLDRLKEREIAPFIAHRLQAASCTREDLFTEEAIQRIAAYSQGVPRLINILCDNVLLLGYSISQQTISAEMVEEVSQDLGLHDMTLVAEDTLATAREKAEVLVDVLPSSTLPTAGLPFVIQSQPPIQLTTSMVITTTRAKPENPSRRPSSRRLAWAGTGLAFALWSFTLFPYGEEPAAPLTSSAPSQSKTPTLVDQALAFFGHNEVTPERGQQETTHSSPTTKATSTNTPLRDAGSLPRKEENKPSPAKESVNASSSQTHPERNKIQQSVSVSEESPPLVTHEPELIDVASQGDQQEALRLLEAGAQPNVPDERGWTALMMATLHGHTSVVQLLLKKGATVNLSNSTGGTALMMAALQGQDSILQLLLDNGASVNTQDAKGWTALMYAARNGYASTVEVLLSRGAEVNLKNDEGRTALMYATAKGHREAIHVLQNGKAVSSAVN
jgi:general secretion pathway protein A